MPIHLVQRGIDHQACFVDDADRLAYLDDLARIATGVGCAMHAYVHAGQRYVELNPVRAGMVTDPRDDAWSNHRDNLGGAPDGVLTAQASYLALGPDRTARAAA